MNQTNQIAAGTGKPATGVQQEFLTFTLGQEEYGIEILKVQEIRSYEAVTTIANAPEFIKGVVNLHGTDPAGPRFFIFLRRQVHHGPRHGGQPHVDSGGYREADDEQRHGAGGFGAVKANT